MVQAPLFTFVVFGSSFMLANQIHSCFIETMIETSLTCSVSWIL